MGSLWGVTSTPPQLRSRALLLPQRRPWTSHCPSMVASTDWPFGACFLGHTSSGNSAGRLTDGLKGRPRSRRAGGFGGSLSQRVGGPWELGPESWWGQRASRNGRQKLDGATDHRGPTSPLGSSSSSSGWLGGLLSGGDREGLAKRLSVQSVVSSSLGPGAIEPWGSFSLKHAFPRFLEPVIKVTQCVTSTEGRSEAGRGRREGPLTHLSLITGKGSDQNSFRTQSLWARFGKVD